MNHLMLLDLSLYICNITSEMCLFQQVMIFLCYLVPACVESFFFEKDQMVLVFGGLAITSRH